MRWTDERLNQMRQQGDPLADHTIDVLFAQGNLDAVNSLMRTLVENDDIPPDDLPQAIDDYLNASSQLPVWADAEALRRASNLFNRYGPEMILLLFGASLPVLYAAHPGNQVLVATTRLTEDIHRRIIETGQFVIDVTAEDAWQPQGCGIRTTQKVRLMHATIRHFLWHDPKWKDHWQADWQVPICQADLAGTMLSFSVTVIKGLEAMNITINDQEKEDYLHLWKVIGHILGIHEDLMPADYADAEALMNRWSERNHKQSKTAHELMNAMVTFWYDNVPGKLFDRVTTNWARIWIGNDLADLLGIPPFNWTRVINKALMFLWSHEDRFADSFIPYQRIVRFWTRKLMVALLALERGGNRPDFHIPDALQERWNLK